MKKIIPIIFLILISTPSESSTYFRWIRLLTFEDTVFSGDNDLNDSSSKVEAWVKVTGGIIKEVSITLTPTTRGAINSLSLGLTYPAHTNTLITKLHQT